MSNLDFFIKATYLYVVFGIISCFIHINVWMNCAFIEIVKISLIVWCSRRKSFSQINESLNNLNS